MQLQKAQRKNARIKMALQGPSGSGKSYSSLQIARGLCGDWSHICVIDSEHGSANLYAHIGEYNIIELNVPHSPERYTEAIDACVKAGMEVIILDSVTHEWEFLLDYHASLPGNSFTNWSKVTPRHNAFVQKILSSPCHIICTVRTKTDYVMTEKNGKQVPEKVGMKSVQRDGLDYEMTLVFDLDIKNNATASKDRTGLFTGKPEQKLSLDTGRLIADWCNSGDAVTVDEMSSRIESSVSIEELLTLYKMYPQYQEVLHKGYQQKKRELILQAPDERSEIAKKHTSPNGMHK